MSENNLLNIAVIYTSKIPFFKEHFASFLSTGIKQHNTDCFLVIGNEYNEDTEGFKNASICNTTTIIIENQQSHDKIATELLIKNYDLVIYLQTQIIFKCNLNWDLLNVHINDTQTIYANYDNNFIIGSQSDMIKYLSQSNQIMISKKYIEFDYSIKPITNEKYNSFFGFRGLSEVCDSHNYTSYHDDNGNYSIDTDKIKDHDTIYFTNLSLRRLHKSIILIPKQFILVSGGGDCECPNQIFETDDDFQKFINCPNIVHWFCQNVLIKHPKITPIPLGLDYETIMYYNHIRNDRGPKMTPLEQEKQIMDLRKNMLPFWERIPICYGNFQYLLNTKYANDRIDAIKKIPTKLIYYDSKNLRQITFCNQTEFAFVASPFGQDYECIRTWEALCLGCIVIIKTSPIDSIYSDLPVLIINNWSEITQPVLESAIETFKQKHENGEFNYEKLTKKYWSLLIQQKKQEFIY
jgi:hypothetical protein